MAQNNNIAQAIFKFIQSIKGAHVLMLINAGTIDL